MKSNEEPRADRGENNRSEASISPPDPIRKRFEECLNLLKTVKTYTDKTFNSILRLNYELVNDMKEVPYIDG